MVVKKRLITYSIHIQSLRDFKTDTAGANMIFDWWNRWTSPGIAATRWSDRYNVWTNPDRDSI